MVQARKPPKPKPLCERRAIVMEGEEVFEIVKGEEKIRDAGSFGCVEVARLVVVSAVEIEVGPDLDGGGLVVFAGLTVGALDFSKGSIFGDCVRRTDEAERRLESAGRHLLAIEEGL